MGSGYLLGVAGLVTRIVWRGLLHSGTSLGSWGPRVNPTEDKND
jgi:hypothetical protein